MLRAGRTSPGGAPVMKADTAPWLSDMLASVCTDLSRLVCGRTAAECVMGGPCQTGIRARAWGIWEGHFQCYAPGTN